MTLARAAIEAAVRKLALFTGFGRAEIRAMSLAELAGYFG